MKRDWVKEEIGTEINELQRPKRREKQDCLIEEKFHLSKVDWHFKIINSSYFFLPSEIFKYLISGLFLLCLTGDTSKTIPWTVAFHSSSISNTVNALCNHAFSSLSHNDCIHASISLVKVINILRFIIYVHVCEWVKTYTPSPTKRREYIVP